MKLKKPPIISVAFFICNRLLF